MTTHSCPSYPCPICYPRNPICGEFRCGINVWHQHTNSVPPMPSRPFTDDDCDDIDALRAENARLREAMQDVLACNSIEETRAIAACALVARMHAAAVGEVRGPDVGPVEDVAALADEAARLSEVLRDMASSGCRKFNDGGTAKFNGACPAIYGVENMDRWCEPCLAARALEEEKPNV